MRPVSSVSQLSLFSAGARPPQPGDLAGLLCGPGQIVRFGSGDTARLSVVLADPRRAPVVVAACVAVGIDAEPAVTESGASASAPRSAATWSVWRRRGRGRGEEAGARRRTRADESGSPGLVPPGAVKTVPAGMQLDGAVLRVWMVAAGRWDGRGVDLLLDPHAPQTHLALIAAATRAGISPARSGRGTAFRITGNRRIRRFLELRRSRRPQVLLRTSGRRRGWHGPLTARLRSRPSDRRRAECDRGNTWRARREECPPSVDTGGHGDEHRGAARGGQWSGYDVTTGTSPTTDTAADGARAQGGRRPAFRHAHRPRNRPPDAPPGDRRVADQGQEDRALPGQRLRRRVVSRPHPGSSARCRGRPRQVQGRGRGPGSAWTSTTSSSRSTS